MTVNKTKVVFLESTTNAQTLSQISLNNHHSKRYVNFTSDCSINQLLNSNGYSHCDFASNSELEPHQFLSNFVTLMDKVAINNNTITWWSSELGTKNHFTTRLSIQLAQMMLVMNLVQDTTRGILIVLGTDPVVKSRLMSLLKSQGIATLVFSASVVREWRTTTIILHLLNFHKVILQTIALYRRIYLARKYIDFHDTKKRFFDQPIILIKTFLNEDDIGSQEQPEDRYFGNLVNVIKKKKYAYLSLCHIHKGFKSVVRKLNDRSIRCVIPYESLLDCKDALRAGRAALYSRLDLESLYFYGHDVTEIVEKEYLRSGLSVSNYVFYFVGKKISEQFNLTKVVMTYENRGWENAFIRGLKENPSRLHIMGYQHAVISPAATGYFVGVNESSLKPLPDIIYTTGKEPTAILREYGNYPAEKLVVGVGLRYKWLSEIRQRKCIEKRGAILLCLEGVPPVVEVIDYCLRELKLSEKFMLKIRFHPEFGVADLDSRRKKDLSEAPRIEVSIGSTLADDLKEADICMYWGSTVALEALAHGIPLIHFDTGYPINYDPLFRCPALKWVVKPEDSLEHVIESIYKLTTSQYRDESVLGINYVSQYFRPVVEGSLDQQFT